MKYQSTRSNTFTPQTFLQILLGGLAPDGGLYLPLTYPQVSKNELQAWRNLNYADLAFEILRKFCDDVPMQDLKALCQQTYTSQIYCNTRAGSDAAQITPLTLLGEEAGAPLYLQELSNGPTLAFKDMAMQLLGNLFEYALAKNQAQLNIVGATSGDTGSAAEYAMRGKTGIKVFMLSPHQKMSAFQTAQMFSLQDANIFNLAVQGVFDDCQDMVKAVSNDLPFKAAQKIGTVNSINWARVVAQVVYYFKGYFAATESDEKNIQNNLAMPKKHARAVFEHDFNYRAQDGMPLVSFAVPSGNFGNICAGHIARMMGLPIHKLVLATNENNVLDEFFRTGLYRVRKNAETFHTSSPSMDISKASNFERFVFDLVGRDAVRTAALFAKVESQGGFDLSDAPGSDGDEFKKLVEYGLVSGSSTHADRLHTIRDIAQRYQIIVDTHTADGIKVAREHLEKNVPMIVLETAQAAKFAETIQEALGQAAPRPARFAELEQLPQRFEVMAADVVQLKQFVAQHSSK